MTNPLTKLFKSFMTKTNHIIDDSDNGPDIQFGASMSIGKPVEFKEQKPNEELPTSLGGDSKEVFSMFELLNPAQRLEFAAEMLRKYCAGCGNAAPSDGTVCKHCNGAD